MAAILDRYLAREVLTTWLAVTAVLMFILLSNQFARVLGEAAAGQLPRDAVFGLIGLTSLTYLTILVPIALFIAVMLALGRLYSDSEMAALAACGLGPARLYRPLGTLALVLALVLGWLALEVGPWAARQVHVITETARAEAEIAGLEAGRFRSSGRDSLVFYAESVAEDGTLRNVFLQRRRDERVEVATAASGRQRTDPQSGERSIVLREGFRYEGVPGTVNFRVVRFGEHGIPFRTAAPRLDDGDPERARTADLLRSTRPRDVAELQWRISAPVSALLLTLLAVPLARTGPRQGRYGKIALAITVYIVYANLLGAARVWVERGEVGPLPGMWWVHLLVLVGASFMLWRQGRLPPARGGGA